MQDIKTIPAGVPVAWYANLAPPHGEQRVGALLWDGNDFVTRGMFNENLIAKMATENNGKRIQKVILMNVAFIALFLAIFLWRYYQRLKQQN
jgi:hypothetical protein